MFISFLFEYNRWLDCLDDSNTTHFITYLPIQLDASCNGYQHISMLVQDYGLAKHLNLTKSTWDDTPDDFYSFVACCLNEYYDSMLESKDLSDVDKKSLIRLKALKIPRSIIKKAIMTKPYNASSIQTIRYLQELFEFDEIETKLKNKNITVESSYDLDYSSLFYNNEENMDIDIDKYKNINREIWYKHEKDRNIKLESKDFLNLYKGLKLILDKVFPPLNTLSEYFQNVAIICSRLGINIPWHLPAGLKATQAYMEIKKPEFNP